MINIEEIINNSQEKDWKKIYIICQCFNDILKGFTDYLNATTVQSIILQKYIPDLYSGLLQLGYAPLGKPINKNRPPMPLSGKIATPMNPGQITQTQPMTPGQIATPMTPGQIVTLMTPGQINQTQPLTPGQIATSNQSMTPANLASSMEKLSVNQKNERIIYKEKSIAMFNDIYLK